MTDMRATERLLEVIHENARDLYGLGEGFRATYEWVEPIFEAITELRRRGDTLVRADDLREAAEGLGGGIGGDPAKYDAAIARLEHALGGEQV